MMEKVKSEESIINIVIKFQKRSITFKVREDYPIKDLKSMLQFVTNVVSRRQRLFFAAKILQDESTLRLSKVKDGSRIMLVACEDLQQEDDTIKKKAQFHESSDSDDDWAIIIEEVDVQIWKDTGIIALRGRDIKIIPHEVWSVGRCGVVLDVSGTSIQEIPASIKFLPNLKKMYLSDNKISEDFVSWEAFSDLHYLVLLEMNQNQLKSLPSPIGLRQLRHLNVANNELKTLPIEIDIVGELRELRANPMQNENKLIFLLFCVGLLFFRPL